MTQSEEANGMPRRRWLRFTLAALLLVAWFIVTAFVSVATSAMLVARYWFTSDAAMVVCVAGNAIPYFVVSGRVLTYIDRTTRWEAR